MKPPKHPDALVNLILECSAPRPGEEEFWAIIIMPRTSEEPLFAQAGALVDVAEDAARFMRTGKTGPVRFLCFQGEKAHWAMEAIWQ
jgi:hypothetical protein